jgi:hypothetical protein
MYLQARIERKHIGALPRQQVLREHVIMGRCTCIVWLVIVIGVDVAVNNIKVFNVAMEM